ncbi:MAG: hypothetical protein ACP5F8_02460 [Candidatus Aenigmatarchaeota archaeon]
MEEKEFFEKLRSLQEENISKLREKYGEKARDIVRTVMGRLMWDTRNVGDLEIRFKVIKELFPDYLQWVENQFKALAKALAGE